MHDPYPEPFINPYHTCSLSLATFPPPTSQPPILGHRLSLNNPWIPASNAFLHSLTDTRFPKRRPVDKPGRKRAFLRPQGPNACVKYVPDQPILSNQPNVGSVKQRNERMKQKHTFIMEEKRKREAQMQDANQKKIIKRVERKMAAVAKDRAWAQRLAELQQLRRRRRPLPNMPRII